MLVPTAKIIVAVSGGVDSIALLAILSHLQTTYKYRLLVAHVNHQLRGDESEQAALFVEQQAQKFHLPFYQTRLDVKVLQRSAGLSLQQAARQLRYAYFDHLCRSVNATHVALGHTSDDQAETFLIRLLRGSGPMGLAGIPVVRKPFIRPLITVPRAALLAYLQTQCIAWTEDSSNTHLVYLRNRIRQHLIPTLRQFNPQIVQRLNALTDMLGADNRVIEQYVDSEGAKSVTWKAPQVVDIHRRPFRLAPLAIQRRLVRRTLDKLSSSGVSIGFDHVEALRCYINTPAAGRRLSLPGSLVAESRAESVRLWNLKSMPARTWWRELPLPGSLDIGALNMRIRAYIQERPQCLSPQANVALLALESLSQPLRIRFWHAGDRFHPLGGPGSKKLQDFYVDARIPSGDRPYVPLVLSKHEIVWVVGYRIAEPFKVRPETTHVVRLQVCAIINESDT